MEENEHRGSWWKPNWRSRTWWGYNWPIVTLIVLMAVISTITGLGYWQRWSWTGLVDVQDNPSTRPFWDWLGLLVIPVLLGLGAFYFNRQARKAELVLAGDRIRENALQSYLDRMSELVLDKKLRESKLGDVVRYVARAQTLTVLRSLDASRKGQVVRFLYEAGLIGNMEGRVAGKRRVEAIIDLRGADLSGIKLGSLTGANLTGTFLTHADLSYSDWECANLIYARLQYANLTHTQINNANLTYAHLEYANLNFTNLCEDNLSNADLTNADLKGAYLILANLINADLKGANLTGADLTRADLTGAKNWTNQQLAQAASLEEATMPDGTLMTKEKYEEFKKRHQ